MPFIQSALWVVVCIIFNCILSAHSLSLSSENFDKLVLPKCFNSSTTLGQVRPIGLTVENLISMIERAEIQNPHLKPHEILSRFLLRFHFDGLAHRTQSVVEVQHDIVSNAILNFDSNVNKNFDEIENIFTEDEKCNLFFTLSHYINDTASDEDEPNDIYVVEKSFARAPMKEKQNIGTEVPIPVIKKTIDPKDLPPAQSGFLKEEEEKPNVRNTRTKRQAQTQRLTKKPREVGVSSYLSASKKAISMNRVLLGLYVAYSQPQARKISQILEDLNPKFKLPENVDDIPVDPLLSVTLTDLYGMDPAEQELSSANLDKVFGAEGSWNETQCHTKYTLTSNKGVWRTAAEFRGGIDGFNIAKSIENIKNKISASQALRFYYSKQGLIESGICNRNDNLRTEIESDLQKQGTAYLVIWHVFHYLGRRPIEKVLSYGKEIETFFRETMESAKERSPEESALCSLNINGNIATAEIETRADIYLMLDMNKGCEGENSENMKYCNKTAEIISKIVQQLKMGRYQGSVSVFYNIKALEKPIVVGDDGKNVMTKLHSSLFNSTSNQCAACRALDSSEKGLDTVEKRAELFDLILKQIVDLKQSTKQEKQGLPSKVFYWFDKGTVEPLPEDKLKKYEVEKVLRELKYVHRDVQFFGVGINKEALKDLVDKPENLISLDTAQLEQFASGAVKAPQIFEYPFNGNTTSKNVTYNGLITPGYKQYWMMSPTQFIRSKDLEFTFKAKDYPIEVCVDRDIQPEKKQDKCKKASKAGESVTFKSSNPCQGQYFQNCPAFYFTVNVINSGKNKDVNEYCYRKECQNIAQVEWWFSHTGVRGNGSTNLQISILLISVTFLVQNIYNYIF